MYIDRYFDRYVDDIFVVIRNLSDVEALTFGLEQIDENIAFKNPGVSALDPCHQYEPFVRCSCNFRYR